MQPKSMTTSSPASIGATRRPGVRLGAVGPGRDDRVEARAARRPGRASRTRAQSAKSRSVGRSASVGAATSASASSAIAHAAWMRATSAGSFTRRRSSTRSLGGDQLGVGEPLAANARCCAHVTPCASSPRRRRPRRRLRSARRAAPPASRRRRRRASTPAAATCSAACSRVAAVGDEDELVRPPTRTHPALPVKPVR